MRESARSAIEVATTGSSSRIVTTAFFQDPSSPCRRTSSWARSSVHETGGLPAGSNRAPIPASARDSVTDAAQ